MSEFRRSESFPMSGTKMSREICRALRGGRRVAGSLDLKGVVMHMQWIFFALAVCIVFVFIAARPAPLALALNSIKLPPGFTISVFASPVKGARSMAVGSNGELFLGTRYGGNLYAIVDHNKRAHADEVITIDHGLNMPNG